MERTNTFHIDKFGVLSVKKFYHLFRLNDEGHGEQIFSSIGEVELKCTSFQQTGQVLCQAMKCGISAEARWV